MSSRKVFLVCTGLGIVQRGFETYIADLAGKLRSAKTTFAITLYSGGKYESNKVISEQLFCISRNNRFLNFLFGHAFVSELELYSFFVSLFFETIRNKPNVIYLGEYKLYCYLYKIRKLFNLNYSLVLYTGGQVSPGLFDVTKDFVHHVTDVYYSELLKGGYPKERQFVLPHFFSQPENEKVIEEINIRSIAYEKKIIISVGLIDSTIKRMDRLVNVLSKSPDKYFPVLLGEYSSDTPFIKKQLEDCFGKDNYYIGNVSRNELFAYLKQADLFILLSPKESFGLAAIEALSVGLPVICCDYPESRYVLKHMATLIDCDQDNNIGLLIDQLLDHTPTQNQIKQRVDFVNNTYSWDVLSNSYITMFNKFILND